MQLIYADKKKLKGPHSMNGKSGDLRFEVAFIPGETAEVHDHEYKELKKDDSFKFLVDEGILHVKSGGSKQSKLDKAFEEVEKAKKALESSKDEKEKKAASAALKKAETALAKEQKTEKKK